ncbi:MAG: hypothetical protein KAY37_01770 [Phycisphaerae bacterium]|nr:hypothetical protein [Phycisphaerae bacterium]
MTVDDNPDDMDRMENTAEVEDLPETELIVLGYLSCPLNGANDFLGGALITDYRTRPLQFAFVAPVRPTGIQRILYGDTLNEHVKIDVITKKLFSEGVSYEPHVLFVDTEDLVAVRRLVSAPVARLYRLEDSVEPGESLSTLRFDTGGNTDDQALVGTIVARLETYVDLIAPFARLTEALKETLKAIKKQSRKR